MYYFVALCWFLITESQSSEIDTMQSLQQLLRNQSALANAARQNKSWSSPIDTKESPNQLLRNQSALATAGQQTKSQSSPIYTIVSLQELLRSQSALANAARQNRTIKGLLRQRHVKRLFTTTVTEGNYIFEGFDYDRKDVPKRIANEHKDCDGRFILCIRIRTYFTPVCGYDTSNNHYRDFYSTCQLELQNCQLRVVKKLGVYGTNRKNDIIYYNGEDLNCAYYYRRSKTIDEMDRLYFGGDPPFTRSGKQTDFQDYESIFHKKE